MQFKGATKTSYIAHFAFGRHIKTKLLKMRFPTSTKLCFKGGQKYIHAYIKGFTSDKTKINAEIMEIMINALNGCRLKKKRRV